MLNLVGKVGNLETQFLLCVILEKGTRYQPVYLLQFNLSYVSLRWSLSPYTLKYLVSHYQGHDNRSIKLQCIQSHGAENR